MKNKIRLLLILLVSSLFVLTIHSSAKEESLLRDVYDYKIYYDPPTQELLSKMTNYDMVIIEPVYYTKADIQSLKDSGTGVYGYINTMEADTWNTSLFEQLNEDDFFHRNGERVHYSEWDSYLTDITSSHYQQVLADEVEKQIIDKGLDGAFLDTVGNIDNEHYRDADVLNNQRQGLVSWLMLLQEEHPDLSFIQNWGFDTLAEATAPYVDGIMWEGFHLSSIIYDEWANNQVYKLRSIREEHGVEVFTVSFEQEKNSTRFSKANRFKHYHEPDSFNEW
ncbi:endo alpha-1,4 polygalactosaminidase [Salimicrobium flavidum]|uniref:Glycoside-hydrolase family GH114 n=1 Tax=Salimicrobium flavidum TaxID=570947 RepID=A0A1N7J7K8_9BACI|nr:endo alpha-1,4 polygalactosaminidase [Salimicrobium flavidum]SIS45300.1 Glycoside-hydrolase family GH114 [Salimicrobium flavidum]